MLRGCKGPIQDVGLVKDVGDKRGHEFKLFKERVRLEVGKGKFSYRV